VIQQENDSQKTELYTIKSEKISLESELQRAQNKIRQLEGQILEIAEKNKRSLCDLSSETRANDEETVKILKERDFLKTETQELKNSMMIYKNLIGNLEKTLENLKENALRKEREFNELQEKFEKDSKEFRMKINDLLLENGNFKHFISVLNEEIKKKDDIINNKEFEYKNLEFKTKENDLNSFKKELGLQGNYDNLEAKYKEKCAEKEELQEKYELFELKTNEKERFFEEKTAILEKEKQEIEMLLEEKKQENTKLYGQFQVGMKQKHNFETLRLP